MHVQENEFTYTQPEQAPFMTQRPQKACKHFQRSLTNTRTPIKFDSITVLLCKLSSEGIAIPTDRQQAITALQATHSPT